MTEAEWEVCAEPVAMLEQVRRRATDRKLRLFACGCLRRAWHLLTDDHARRAVEVAEAVADSATAAAEWQQIVNTPRPHWGAVANGAVGQLTSGSCFDAAVGVAAGLARAGLPRDEPQWQACLVRCVFGNPFRSLPPLSTHWFVFGSGTVWSLAEQIYTSGAFDQLGILGDALEEAGCTRADLLTHCRSGGGHTRGCWAVDLLLGKS
jgi:hypothetical protein